MKWLTSPQVFHIANMPKKEKDLELSQVSVSLRDEEEGNPVSLQYESFGNYSWSTLNSFLYVKTIQYNNIIYAQVPQDCYCYILKYFKPYHNPMRTAKTIHNVVMIISRGLCIYSVQYGVHVWKLVSHCIIYKWSVLNRWRQLINQGGTEMRSHKKLLIN